MSIPSYRASLSLHKIAALAVPLLVLLATLPCWSQTTSADSADSSDNSAVVLRNDEPRDQDRDQRDQDTSSSTNGGSSQQSSLRRDRSQQGEESRGTGTQERMPPYVPSEFELFVQKQAGTSEYEAENASSPRSLDYDSRRSEYRRREERRAPVIRRFGADLMTHAATSAADFVPQVPSDYLVNVGDELVVTLWGSINGDLRLVVDRSGRISIPRVGTVMVAGVRYADLHNVIADRVAQVFRNFQVSVSLGKLRAIRIYVTGFVQRPGSYTVSSLSTILSALIRTGGPSAAGSFRNIELHRDGRVISNFDLYDLLLRGDKTADRVLQAEDVIQVGAVGPQVALIGSVNKPAIFELAHDETVRDVIGMAGGFNTVADKSRLAIERLSDRDGVRVREIALPADEGVHPTSGDVMRAFSLVQTALPVERQNKRVRVEGEVSRPGDYVLPLGSTLNDALRAAGGLTPGAFLYGSEFMRESVRKQQQENYDRALRDLETRLTAESATQHAGSNDEAAAQATKAANAQRLIDQLRAVQPSGRIVLQLTPDATSLPDIKLEDGDRVYVPAKPTTVGVFGSVFNGGSYLFQQQRTLSSFIALAGGATVGADVKSTFVIRANGTVVSARQSGGGWFGVGGFDDVKAEPGDTIFVPEQTDKTTFVQAAKDWTQILYQFGLGIAAIHTLQ